MSALQLLGLISAICLFSINTFYQSDLRHKDETFLLFIPTMCIDVYICLLFNL